MEISLWGGNKRNMVTVSCIHVDTQTASRTSHPLLQSLSIELIYCLKLLQK